MAPRETGNNAYTKFWSDKQRALWYVIVFLEWSIVGEHQNHQRQTTSVCVVVVVNEI